MLKEVKKLLGKAVLALQKDGGFSEIPEINVEHPKDEQFGDYTSNIAMVLGKELKKNPLEIADQIAKWLNGSIADSAFSKIEVAKPGYLNFYLAPKYFQDKVAEINAQENNFGSSEIGKGIKVNNEFISANPTGPLHLGNGRGGFYGDTITQILRKAGFEAVSEYYINDAGEQVLKLGHSVLKDAEACYSGEYIDDLNQRLAKLKEVGKVGAKAAEVVMEEIVKKTIAEKMQIQFDVWTSEKKDLVEKDYVEKAIEKLKEKKLAFENEGALWLRTTDFGDDKDRVLIKSDGQKTYFASDCGYLLYKMERGFAKIIEIWGADHHGYTVRFEAAARALGFAGEIKFIIVQLVSLLKDGKVARMSKRAGNIVYIDELIEEVGHDAARFFFLLYSPDSHLNFDLELAKERSQKNPVYYVQYAHARISSILKKSQTTNYKLQTEADLLLLTNEKEISLIRELDKFTELVEELSKSYEVHKLAHYALKLADKFHSFYDECQVVDEANPALSQARLELVKCVKIVLAETLRLIGVTAPEKM